MKSEWTVPMSSGQGIMGLLLLLLLLFHLVIMASGARELSLQQQQQSDHGDNDAVGRLLMAFKQSSVQSDPKGFLADWRHDGDLCSWRAISCSPTTSSLEHLALILSCLAKISLFLTSPTISFGEIPTCFVSDSPASLLYLDFSHNNFSGSFSTLDFGRCPNLTSLSLANNARFGDNF